MTRKTLKSLEAELATTRELREGDRYQMDELKRQLVIVKSENEYLKSDKQWLKQMHSALLQATSEMFRNR